MRSSLHTRTNQKDKCKTKTIGLISMVYKKYSLFSFPKLYFDNPIRANPNRDKILPLYASISDFTCRCSTKDDLDKED
jgi:hypothetical protein